MVNTIVILLGLLLNLITMNDLESNKIKIDIVHVDDSTLSHMHGFIKFLFCGTEQYKTGFLNIHHGDNVNDKNSADGINCFLWVCCLFFIFYGIYQIGHLMCAFDFDSDPELCQKNVPYFVIGLLVIFFLLVICLPIIYIVYVTFTSVIYAWQKYQNYRLTIKQNIEKYDAEA